MAGTGRKPAARLEEIVETEEDTDDEAAAAGPAAAGRPLRRGRAPKVRIAAPAAAGRAPRGRPAAAAPPAAPAPAIVAADAHTVQAWMQGMERQMQQLMDMVGGGNSDDEDSVAGAPDPDRRRPRAAAPHARSVPRSELMPHIPRQDMAWWDNHPTGTPIPYKDLPGQLRQAMDKNPRDRLEVQQTYTALTLAASLLDVLVAITDDGQLHHAQLGLELILNHLFPLLARRVDALQQDGALRSVFMSALDPRSQYFIADTDTSYGILQKVSTARVQALMTKAGRREEDADRRSNSRGSNSQQRQSGGGSQRQRARDRGTSTNGTNNANGNSNRRGTSRERGSRERGPRDGGASSSSAAPASGEDRRN